MNEDEVAYEVTPKGLAVIYDIPDGVMDTIQRWYDERRQGRALLVEASDIIAFLMEKMQAIYVADQEGEVFEIAKEVLDSVVPTPQEDDDV